jgi:putative PIN family toxin of toxin-antitoxin system
MHTVVIDTMVFVRALLNPRSMWGRLVFDYADRYRLVVSAPIVREVLEVLQRPELVRKFPRTLPTRSPTTILDILSTAEAVEIADAVPAITRDPKDDKFLITAALAGADYLVTEDTDILDDFTEYQGVRIATAAAFLQVLEEQDDESGHDA